MEKNLTQEELNQKLGELRAIYSDFYGKLQELQTKKSELIESIIKKIDSKKIEEMKKMLDSL